MASFSRGFLICVVVSVCAWLAEAKADEFRSVTLTAPMRFSGSVERAFLILADGKSVRAVAPAVYTGSSEGSSGTLVARVSIPQERVLLQALFVMIGVAGEVRSSYREFQADELPPSVFLQTSDMRSRLVERRGVLRALQTTFSAQQERVASLEADADAIANVSKIVEVEDELGGVKAAIARVTSAQMNIEGRMSRIKQRGAPLNAQKREVELTRQLGELSTALSTTETNALRKISGAQAGLQEKLRLIEDTRHQHVELLEQELTELKRRRQGVGLVR